MLAGFNDLATLFPEVADEWSDKNEKKPTEVTAFANSKAWWKCKTCGYGYMMMSRLGINAEEYFEADDFRDVTNFNTQDTLNALGIATSDIAEMGLSEISKTVMALDRENRIIDEQRQFDYNKDNKDERSQNDERNHIHDGGRLQSSELDSARTVGSDSRQMVEDEENLSERTSQNIGHKSSLSVTKIIFCFS